MLLTVSITHRLATDLGYLLHKHPDRVQEFKQSFGSVTVCYPQATEERWSVPPLGSSEVWSPYNYRTMVVEVVLMAAKTRRLELRTDEATDRLIGEAAALLHTTKSAFVADAAREAAQKVLARADVTLMAAEVFDALVASLDVVDEAPELEQKLARLPRLIER